MITLHDRFVLRNHSGVPLEWAQATEPQGGEAGSAPDWEAEPLPPDGREVPLRWRAEKGQRRICVRPASGGYAWCAPFSPEALGKTTLKLRNSLEYMVQEKVGFHVLDI